MYNFSILSEHFYQPSKNVYSFYCLHWTYIIVAKGNDLIVHCSWRLLIKFTHYYRNDEVEESSMRDGMVTCIENLFFNDFDAQHQCDNLELPEYTNAEGVFVKETGHGLKNQAKQFYEPPKII